MDEFVVTRASFPAYFTRGKTSSASSDDGTVGACMYVKRVTMMREEFAKGSDSRDPRMPLYINTE